MSSCVIIGSGKPEGVFCAANGNTSSPFNTLTRTGISFGTERARRRMILFVWGRNANLTSDAFYTTSASIGGVAATRFIAPSGNLQAHFTAWRTPDLRDGGPSGSSGSVVVTRNIGNGFSGMGWVLFAVYNMLNALPQDTLLDEGTSPQSATIDLQNRGVFVGACRSANAVDNVVTNFTWGGATEVAQQMYDVGNSATMGGALLNDAAAQTGRTISVSSPSGLTHYLIGAAFR